MLDFEVHSSAPFSTLGNLTGKDPFQVPWQSNTHLNPAANTTSNGSMEKADVMGSFGTWTPHWLNALGRGLDLHGGDGLDVERQTSVR